MKNISLLLCLTIMFSCANEKKDLRRRDIIGKWSNISLLVTMKRLEKGDSVLRANEGEWERVLKMKPILSEFKEDGTFTSKYTNLQEEIIREVSGQWSVRNDSLVIITDGQETTYHFEITNNRIRFKSKLDWDGDGKFNDEYDAVQIRVEN